MLQEEIVKEKIIYTNLLEKQNQMENDKKQNLEKNSDMFAQVEAVN